MTSFEEIREVLDSGTKEEKIAVLEHLSKTDNPDTVRMIISKLDDEDIQVRGEAFSSLLLNQNDIDKILISSLKSQSKNVRGYASLVLANRNAKDATKDIIELANDQSAMVRSCAIGALGYLRASDGVPAIARCLDDPNQEVRKSAIKSAIDIADASLLRRISRHSGDDPETIRLIGMVKV